MIIGGEKAGATNAGATDPNGLIVEGSDQSFGDDVMAASMETPVVVDFWAPWCGPCQQLTPALEEAVQQAKGRVKLVKINIDEHQAIAAQLQVQSIPAVFAFSGGRPVDGFMGALPASEVKRFVEKLAGAQPDAQAVEALVERAHAALEAGDVGGAAQDFAEALRLDDTHVGALAGMAQCYIKNDELEQAEQFLNAVPDDKANDPVVESARTMLALALGADDAGDTDQFQAALDADPNDHQARFDLAKALAARGRFEPAADHLLTILGHDLGWNDGAAKEELLTVFQAAGPTSSVTTQGRRRLSTLVFA